MIQFTDEMRESIRTALADRLPMTLAYADAEGRPALSFRGTVYAYSDDQLALWARSPEGGLPLAIASNPHVSMLYANLPERRVWEFQGRARIEPDEATRRTIYDATPEAEQQRDPERAGVALIVDIDRIIQRGQVIMQR